MKTKEQVKKPASPGRGRMQVCALAFILFNAFPVSAQELLKTSFFPEPAASAAAADDSLGGSSLKEKRPVEAPSQSGPPSHKIKVAGADVYLQDGSETSLAVNFDDGNNLIGVYNQYWGFNPSIPHSNSTNGNLSWTSRTFPVGSGPFTGYPFDPWASQGNAAGEFFSTEIRWASTGESTHCVISRSTDGGASFSLFYEETNTQATHPIQDKEAVDVDRTEARGGDPGSAHDGKVYLCYDLYTPDFNSYGGTFLQVISPAGAPLVELPIQAGWPQPVAGTVDGTVYVKSGSRGGGELMSVRFHEITNGGAGPNTMGKSAFSYRRVGQLRGARPCVNGHRIDPVGYLDIDRSAGPRRGYLYYISNRNPNPDDVTLDQGDVYLSVSTNNASTWSTAVVPAAASKTQYFPMLDVDNQGWLHIAYYQNDTGVVNGGVLEAGTANLYYTLSFDGGNSWTPPLRVNDPTNALKYEEPPPNLGTSQYLIGDYQSIQAAGSGASTKAYVLWSGYDKDRSGCCVGDAKAQVWCTTVQSLPQCQNDTTAPVISCPADLFQNADSGHCTAAISYAAGASDNCPLSVGLACNPSSGSVFPAGATLVTCVATDASNNADTCNFMVTVIAPARGDVNRDNNLTAADAVAELNCVFLGSGSCEFCTTDVNCSGDLTAADAVLELNAVFLGSPFPC